MKKPPLAKAERDLNRAEKLIELYEPFILHNEHVFECENARLLSAALPADERAQHFAFEPEAIDWWDYWINIHVPALRRWCYPLMEGRPLESRPPRDVGLGARAVRDSCGRQFRGESLSRYGNFSHWLNRISRELSRDRICSAAIAIRSIFWFVRKVSRKLANALAIAATTHGISRISGTASQTACEFFSAT